MAKANELAAFGHQLASEQVCYTGESLGNGVHVVEVWDGAGEEWWVSYWPKLPNRICSVG